MVMERGDDLRGRDTPMPHAAMGSVIAMAIEQRFLKWALVRVGVWHAVLIRTDSLMRAGCLLSTVGPYW